MMEPSFGRWMLHSMSLVANVLLFMAVLSEASEPYVPRDTPPEPLVYIVITALFLLNIASALVAVSKEQPA
jgi:hypothetical protein